MLLQQKQFTSTTTKQKILVLSNSFYILILMYYLIIVNPESWQIKSLYTPFYFSPWGAATVFGNEAISEACNQGETDPNAAKTLSGRVIMPRLNCPESGGSVFRERARKKYRCLINCFRRAGWSVYEFTGNSKESEKCLIDVPRFTVAVGELYLVILWRSVQDTADVFG